MIAFTPPPLADYVIIKPHWMCTTIVGQLLSKYLLRPPYITYDQNGCPQLHEVERILTANDVPGDFAGMVAHESGLFVERASDAVVPAKIAASRLNTDRKAPAKLLLSGSVHAAWRLVSRGSVGISSMVFPLLQATSHELFKRDYDVQVPLWKQGLAVTLSETGKAQAIVQSGPELRSIDIIVRGSKDSVHRCSDFLRLLTDAVLDKTMKLSPGSQPDTFFEIAKLSAEGCIEATSCTAYSEQNVQEASMSDECISTGRAYVAEKVDSVLLSENETRGE